MLVKEYIKYFCCYPRNLVLYFQCHNNFNTMSYSSQFTFSILRFWRGHYVFYREQSLLISGIFNKIMISIYITYQFCYQINTILKTIFSDLTVLNSSKYRLIERELHLLLNDVEMDIKLYVKKCAPRRTNKYSLICWYSDK